MAKQDPLYQAAADANEPAPPEPMNDVLTAACLHHASVSSIIHRR